MFRKKQPVSFQDELVPGEQILWEGSPSISFFHFIRLKIVRPTVFFYIVGIAFLIGFVYGGNGQPFRPRMETLLAALFIGMALIVVIPYILFVYYREYRTYGIGHYAVTDKRILVRGKTGILSMPINAIPGIVKQDNPNGLGTINFQSHGSPVLYRIKDADKVYKLITELRSKTS